MGGVAIRRSTVVGVFLAILCLVQSPVAAQHKTTLKRRGETVFSSLPFDPAATGGLALSPGATRSAYVRPKEAGVCAVIDGAEGPVYAGIGRSGVIFSDDSGHWAYAAQKDQRWFVVSDAGEGDPFDAVRDDTITFGPDGTLAFAAQRAGKWRVVAGGREGEAHDRIVEGSIVFNPAGGDPAYAADDGAGEFVVHGKARGLTYSRVGRPRFSRDGARLAYAASTRDESFVVVDGEAAAPRHGAVAVHPLSVMFSPDGRRIAYVAGGPDGRERVVLDGAEGKAYDRVFDDSLAFAADSSRLAYVAKVGKRTAVVLDGVEVGRHDGVAPGTVRLSPDGRRVAYVAERAGKDGSVRRCPAVDGAEGNPYDWIGEAPCFSPDGRHVAFIAQRRRAEGDGTDRVGFESVLVVDGAESAGAFPWIRGDVMFTADGRRVAYLAAAADPRFADAALVPRLPGDPTAGARMVFHGPPTDSRRVLQPGGQAAMAAPIKLLIVEEDVEVE
jgi:hypothetical protein